MNIDVLLLNRWNQQTQKQRQWTDVQRSKGRRECLWLWEFPPFAAIIIRTSHQHLLFSAIIYLSVIVGTTGEQHSTHAFKTWKMAPWICAEEIWDQFSAVMADDRQQNFGKWLQLLSQKFPSGFAVRKAAPRQINQSFHTKPNMALILAGVLKKDSRVPRI